MQLGILKPAEFAFIIWHKSSREVWLASPPYMLSSAGLGEGVDKEIALCLHNMNPILERGSTVLLLLLLLLLLLCHAQGTPP